MRYALLVVLLTLAACGQKGPLYLPDEEPAEAAPVSEPDDEEDEDDGDRRP